MFDKLLGKKLEPNNKPDNGAESIDQNSLKIIKEL